MGKGHRQRPTQVSQDELADRWAATFGIPFEESDSESSTPHACPCGDPQEHQHSFE